MKAIGQSSLFQSVFLLLYSQLWSEGFVVRYVCLEKTLYVAVLLSISLYLWQVVTHCKNEVHHSESIYTSDVGKCC